MKKHKPNSKNRNLVIVLLDDESVQQFDFGREVTEWMDIKKSPEYLNEVFATVLNKAQVKTRPKEAEAAMEQELKKFRDYDAFKVVEDNGQYAIKTRWVHTDQENDGKGVKLKSRLCMRGDLEENIDDIRADSPTVAKDSLKLALTLAANEGFEIFAVDIQSAFLQGKNLERDVFVVPPPEAKMDGKLWLLQKAAYGLLDGSRLFYLEMKHQLEKFGFKEISGDSAFFTYHKAGELMGFACIHVDDLLLMGNDDFKQLAFQNFFKTFKISKVEHDKFKYLGCDIERKKNGDITLQQNEYIKNIKEVECPALGNSCPVKESERKEIRRVVGELLWVSLMTRPDLEF